MTGKRCAGAACVIFNSSDAISPAGCWPSARVQTWPITSYRRQVGSPRRGARHADPVLPCAPSRWSPYRSTWMSPRDTAAPCLGRQPVLGVAVRDYEAPARLPGALWLHRGRLAALPQRFGQAPQNRSPPARKHRHSGTWRGLIQLCPLLSCQARNQCPRCSAKASTAGETTRALGRYRHTCRIVSGSTTRR